MLHIKIRWRLAWSVEKIWPKNRTKNNRLVMQPNVLFVELKNQDLWVQLCWKNKKQKVYWVI